MGRPQTIDDDALIAGLAEVFQGVGYEAASLSDLSRATGLQKASLYHRFPGGKRQMAEEVLSAALGWFQAHVIARLHGTDRPEQRLAAVITALDGFYVGGRKACLLNMLASPRAADGPFSPAIKAAFEALIDAFARLAVDAGQSPVRARDAAERAVVLFQGGLVLSRGLGSNDPFQRSLEQLADGLLVPDRMDQT